MAYTPLSLIAMGGAKHLGQTAWLYSTTDAMTTVDNTDYFAGALWRGMKVGDPVFVIKTDRTSTPPASRPSTRTETSRSPPPPLSYNLKGIHYELRNKRASLCIVAPRWVL